MGLGRKCFPFVGHDNVGDNVATLYSLAASCELHEVDTGPTSSVGLLPRESPAPR